MSKIVRLTESELTNLIKRLVESSFEDETEHEYEEVPDISDDTKISFEDDDFFEDLSLEKGEDDYEVEPEDFDKEMKTKSFMKQNKPSSVSMGGKWQHQEPYNPIKPSDMPLSKYLKMKKK